MTNGSGFESLRGQLEASPLIAVLVIEDAGDAVPLAQALLRGGVRAMELTLRTHAALDALVRIREGVPGMLAGVGTILTPAQVAEVAERGAAFGVSPGMNPRVVDAAAACGLPFAPGVSTPSEIEAALEKGCRIMKLFPAEPLGGIPYLKSVNAPYAHLGVSYIPLGGLTAANMEAYLACPEVLALGGSWLATKELVRAKDWDAVARNCETAVAIAARARGR